MKYKVRAYHKPGKMNQLEKSYANHLALLKAAGEIEDFAFEPEKLRIGDNCHYTPDFRVIRNDKEIDSKMKLLLQHPDIELISGGTIEFHEVKAAWKVKGKPGEVKPHCEDDALVKIKAAANGMHPYKFIMVWLNNGKWEQREFN